MGRLLFLYSFLAFGVATQAICSASAAPAGFASAYLSGLVAEQRGEIGRASTYFAHAQETAPETPMLQRRVMRLQLLEGQFDSAAKAARLMAKSGDDNFPTTLIRLVDFLRDGNFKGALNLVNRPGSNGLSPVVMVLGRAWSLAGEGKVDEAIKVLTDSAKENPDLQTLFLLHAAFLAEQATRLDIARWLYEESLSAAEAEKQTISPRLIHAVSGFFDRRGMSTEAAEVRAKGFPSLDIMSPAQSIVTSPSEGFAEALFNIAGSLYGDRQYIQALSYTRLSEVLRPNDPSVRFTTAQILEALGRYMDAVEAYELVPKVGSYGWKSRLRLAESLSDAGDSEGAINAMRHLLDMEPDEPQVALTLGNILRAHNYFPEAVKAYDEAVRRQAKLGKIDAWLHYARGVALDRSGRWPEAEKEFLESLKMLSEEPLILNYLGYSWIDRGENIERAYAMVARAVELKPDDGFIRDSLGWAEFRTGKFEKAVITLELAIEMQPIDPVINEHLGDAYWQVGRFREARFQWRRALSFEPEDKQVSIIETKLKCGFDGCLTPIDASNKSDNGN